MNMNEYVPSNLDFNDPVDPRLGKAMTGIYRVPHIEFGRESYNQFITDFATSAALHLFWASQYMGDVSSYRTQLINLKGDPGSGKTWLMGKVKAALEAMEIPEEAIEVVSWEKDGEQKAIDKGYIKSPVHKIFRWHEVFAAEREYRQSKLTVLRSRPLVVIAEDPGGIAAEIDGKWKVKRPLGGTVGKEVSRREGEFAEIPYDEWNLVSVEGQFLRQALVYGRQEVRNAPTLERAVDVAKIYGIIGEDQDMSEDEWAEKKNGASLEQIAFIEQKRQSLLYDLSNTPVMRKVQNYAALIDSYDPLTRSLIPEGQLEKLAKPWELGAMWEYILRSHKVEETRTFIGYNNVSPMQLGLNTPEKRERLRKHLEQYRQIAA